MHHARCLCGKVSVTVNAEITSPNACHCSMCRKSSGHYWASTEVPKSAVVISGADNITWFQSSAKVRRGFCKHCGSNMFFDALFQDWTAIAMGAFDGPTGAQLAGHIFTDDKGDYYEITDGLPQNGQ